jgi:two-component system nitrogen regulation response regulator GlnG
VIKANVKIIAATHQNLQEKINNKEFREDLFHRLNVITIHLPPLRQRENDILLLAKFFLNQSAKELKTNSKYLNEETQEYFKKLNWTGNIRQLRNICHWLTVMSPGKEIGISDLPTEILKENIYNKISNNWEDSLRLVLKNELSNNSKNLYDLYVSKLETIIIKASLDHCGGKKINAAQILGIGRNTITRKIKDLNITTIKDN